MRRRGRLHFSVNYQSFQFQKGGEVSFLPSTLPRPAEPVLLRRGPKLQHAMAEKHRDIVTLYVKHSYLARELQTTQELRTAESKPHRNEEHAG